MPRSKKATRGEKAPRGEKARGEKEWWSKKASTIKRDPRVVTYIRVQPQVHAQIAKIANDRGYPHTIASVATEMVIKGLATEPPAPPAANGGG